MIMVALNGWYLVSCGGDDDGIEKNENVNNGGDDNGGGNAKAPKELIGAWQRSGSIYVFKNDGTGKIYNGWNYANNTAESIADFTYSYNNQNATLTYLGNNYTLAFKNENTKMDWSINGEVIMVFYIYEGELPKVGGNEDSGDEGNDDNSEQVPSTPTSVTARVDGSTISISWQSVSGANSYKIYRSTSAYGSYSLIGTAISASYRDSSPVSGYNYYKVSAVNVYGESQQSGYASCNYTDSNNDNTVPSVPSGLSAVVDGSAISISWYSVSGANSYKVYRSTSAYGSYSLVGTVYSASYRDSSPVSGYNYYKVSAVNNYGESQQSSYVSCNYTSGGGIEYSPCPPTVKVSGTTSQTVTWTNPTSSGCGKPTKYEVYKRNPNTGSYELKKTITSTSYSPSSADIHPGKNMYGIKAINNTGSDTGVAYSQDVPLAKPSTFSAQKQGSNQIKFTWSKVTWATGYQIHMSSSASGSYYAKEEVDDGTKTSVTIDLPGASGQTYYFKIKAFFTSYWSDRIYSDLSTYKSVTF